MLIACCLRWSWRHLGVSQGLENCGGCARGCPWVPVSCWYHLVVLECWGELGFQPASAPGSAPKRARECSQKDGSAPSAWGRSTALWPPWHGVTSEGLSYRVPWGRCGTNVSRGHGTGDGSHGGGAWVGSGGQSRAEALWRCSHCSQAQAVCWGNVPCQGTSSPGHSLCFKACPA